MTRVIPINERWEIVRKGNVYKKAFNAFFLDYKTLSTVADEIYQEKRERNIKLIIEKGYIRHTNTGYVSHPFNRFKEFGYLDEPKTVHIEKPRHSKKGKENMSGARVDYYRGNLNPFFEWLDTEIEKKLNLMDNYESDLKITPQEAFDSRRLLKNYLEEFFESLDNNGVGRDRIMKDKDVDIITTIQDLVIKIQDYVTEYFTSGEGRTGKYFSSIRRMVETNGRNSKISYPEVPLRIEKEDLTVVGVPDPFIFFYTPVCKFVKIIFPKRTRLKIEKIRRMDKRGHTYLATIC
ncbi:MAG: hypothetical protein NT130_04510 [Candidatus Micrarchaeota archaeon]|nr:hypothetical protein [Candidatus Micrarchaeota archaeon]